jgi:hypothetical protein
MQQPPRQPKRRLEVLAADEATEIQVQDGRLRAIAQGRGTLELTLDPGAYQVVGRSGDATPFKKLVLLADRDEVVRIPQLQISSPAPLQGTRGFDAWVANDARQLAGTNQHHSEKLGVGSAIFLCARDVPRPGDRRVPPGNHPLTGLSLCDVRGAELLKLEQVAPNQWQWAARTLTVAPGTYRLRLRLPTGDVLEQVLVASEGWMTQVFLVRKFYGEKPDTYLVDLASSSIFLELNVREAFDPSDRDTRLTELAHQGLARGRQVLSDAALRETFEGKFHNPMLGILGAHLLLLEHPRELPPDDPKTPTEFLREHLDRRMKQLFGGVFTFKMLITNLRHLFNMKPHPDVEALALLLEEGPPPAPLFSTPPMLQQSWSLIVVATARLPALVPPGSVSADVALHVLNAKPWMLLWTPSGDPALQEERVARYQKAVQSALDPAPPPADLIAVAEPAPAADAMPVQADIIVSHPISRTSATQGVDPAGGAPFAPLKTHPTAPDRTDVAPTRHSANQPPRGGGGPVGGGRHRASDGGPGSPATPAGHPESSRQRQELVRKLGLPMSSIQQLAVRTTKPR